MLVICSYISRNYWQKG